MSSSEIPAGMKSCTGLLVGTAGKKTGGGDENNPLSLRRIYDTGSRHRVSSVA